MKKILLGMAVACLGIATNSSAQGLSQNFEGVTTPALPSGWTNATTGGGTGWVTNSGTYNWPLYSITAHTKYCLVDDNGSYHNNPSYLTSPTFSIAGFGTPYLAYDWFYIHAWLTASPNPHEQAWVELSTDGGGSYNFIDSVPGFSSSVTDWATQFVNLSSYIGSSNCKLRFCYADQGGTSTSGIIGCAVDNILVYDAALTDIAATTVSPVAGSAGDYFLVGAGATFSGTITNYSTTSVASYTAYYQVGAGTPVSTVITGPVTGLSTGSFTITPAYTVASATQLPVKVWVKATGDANATNDTIGTSVIGVSFMPKKRMLFEEATGSWCGWCVRGIVYMDSIWRAHPNDVNVVSVHNSDPMANMNTSTTKYDAMLGTFISGYPSMVIDRRYVDDPSGCFGDYATDNSMFGFADMGIKYTTTGGKVKATVRVQPALNMTGDYRIELILEEDAVHKGGGALGSNGWKQHNYYAVGGAGHSTPMQTIGYNFNTSPTDIDTPTMKYPFVARLTVPANLQTTPNGISGSLPSSMTSGTVYTYVDSSMTIDANWDATKLRVIALLIDANATSPTYGQVLNSVSTPGIFVGVSDVKAGIGSMVVYPNPATDVANVKFDLNNTSNVTITVVDMMGREVATVPTQNMKAGEQQISLSTSNMATGIYNVILHTENGVVSQRLSVIR